MRQKILAVLSLVLFLLACGHSIRLGENAPEITTIPDFTGEKGERHRLTEINILPPIVLDSVHTAWLSADGQIQIFHHGKGKEVERIDGKTEITNLAYQSKDFYWIEHEGKRRFVRFNSTRGNEVWRIEGFPSAVNPVLWQGRCIFFGVGGKVQAVDNANGQTAWTITLNSRIFVDPVRTESGLLISGDEGTLYLIDPSDGAIRWKRTLQEPALAMNSIDGQIYLGTHNGRMIAFDPGVKSIRWEVDTAYPVRDIPIRIQQYLYWTNTAGELYKIRVSSGAAELLRHLQTPVESPPIQAGNGILFAGLDGMLYYLNPETGSVNTRVKFDGRLRSAPLFFRDKWYVSVEDHWIYEVL